MIGQARVGTSACRASVITRVRGTEGVRPPLCPQWHFLSSRKASALRSLFSNNVLALPVRGSVGLSLSISRGRLRLGQELPGGCRALPPPHHCFTSLGVPQRSSEEATNSISKRSFPSLPSPSKSIFWGSKTHETTPRSPIYRREAFFCLVS